MSRRRKTPLFVLLALAPGCASTANKPAHIGPPPASDSSAPVLLPDPAPGKAPTSGSSVPGFADALIPWRIRIHPLTRFALDSNGDLELVCHLELLDRFDQPVKGLGVLRLELYRPGEESRASGRRQEAVWTVDLRSPEDNAQAYDSLVTRTYVTRLAQIPASIRNWLGVSTPGSGVFSAERPDAGEGDTPSGSALTLKAYFTVTDSSGKQHVLQASHRVQR